MCGDRLHTECLSDAFQSGQNYIIYMRLSLFVDILEIVEV